MTVLDLTRTAAPTPSAQHEPTKASRSLADLKAMLDDPQWAEHHDDIRAAMSYLTTTSALEA